MRVVGASMIVAALVGCGAKVTHGDDTEDAGVSHDDANDDTGAEVASDETLDDAGADATPPTPEGTVGIADGDVIPNATFNGRRGDDASGTTTSVSLWSYYDPDGSRGLKGLYVAIEAAWCGPCNVLAKNLAVWSPTYEAHGAVMFDVMWEDATSKPASLDTVDKWISTYHEPNFVGVDPSGSLIPTVISKLSVPRAYIVDPRTMKIFRVVDGIDVGWTVPCVSSADCCDPATSPHCAVPYACSTQYDACLDPSQKDPLPMLGALMRIRGSDLPLAFPP